MPETKDEIVPLTAEEINTRLTQQMAKLRVKDQTSKQLSKEVGSFDLFISWHGELFAILSQW